MIVLVPIDLCVKLFLVSHLTHYAESLAWSRMFLQNPPDLWGLSK